MESKVEIEHNKRTGWRRKIFTNLKAFSIFDYTAFLLLFAAMVFRAYKMHNAGIIFDEVWTYEEFATSLKRAMTDYHSTNNHLLNSVFIVFAKKIFGGYEHFLRVPSTLFGVIFCISIFKILRKTITSKLIMLASLGCLLFQWFVFDLSFLARGYAIALGSVFGAVYVVISLALSGSEGGLRSWVYIILMIMANLISVGAMLSSVTLLFTINLCFIIVFILKTKFQSKFTTALQLFALIGGSIMLILLFYSSVLSSISYQAESFKESNVIGSQFVSYMSRVLRFPFLFNSPNIKLISTLYAVIVSLIAISLCVVSVWYVIKLKSQLIKNVFLSGRGILVFISIVTFLLMVLQQQVLGISLGMPRNGVFFLVSVLLASVALLDLLASSTIDKQVYKVIASVAFSVLLVMISVLCFPVLSSVNVHPWGWSFESVAGPLLRELKQIDSNKKWRIKLAPTTKDCWRPVRYYNSYGYKAEIVKDNNYDVYILPIIKPDPRMSFLNYEKYIEHHVLILANERSFKNVPLQRLSSK